MDAGERGTAPQTKKVQFVPRFSGPIYGRTINIIKSFYPKLCAEHEFEDLVQEAYLVFYKCKKNFRGDNAAWFMALYSRSLINKMINILDKSGRYSSIEELAIEDEPATKFDRAFLMVSLKELPARARYQLGIFLEGKPGKEQVAYRTLMGMFPELV